MSDEGDMISDDDWNVNLADLSSVVVKQIGFNSTIMSALVHLASRDIGAFKEDMANAISEQKELQDFWEDLIENRVGPINESEAEADE